MIERSITSPVFVGRQDELAVLDDARRALAQSQGSVVLVGGEPGIGKTRLMTQFMRAAAEGRTRNLAVAECIERAQQPFGPIRTFVEAFGQSANAGDVPSGVRLAQSQLVPTKRAPQDATAEKTTALEKAQLFPALVAFFKLVADKRATILAIEDIHWADASTLDFLSFMVPQIAGTRLMVIATYRSEHLERKAPLTKALARLSREPHVRHIVLDPLSPKDVGALMAGALGELELPTHTKRDIEERCDGNPFFAEELLKSAVARPSSRGNAPLPLSIRATILERLSVFTDDERRVLAHAAVLGYRFDPALLAIVMRRGVDALLPTLRRARDMQILIEESGERALCRFRHALTRRTIYEDMLGFDLRRMHENILTTLEGIGDPQKHIDELAYHAWEAKDAPRSLSYNERAGDAAIALRALPEAATNFQRALEASSDGGDRARLLTRLGSVADLQGRLSDAIESFEAALALRLTRDEYDEAAPIVGWIAGARNNLGERGAVAPAQLFLREFGDRLNGPARNSLAVFVARILSARYDFAAIETLLSGVAPAELPPRVRQNYILIQINRHACRGDVTAWKQAVRDFDRFSAAVPEFLRIIALYTIGQTGTYLAAHDQTERALDEADRLVAQWGFGAIDVFGAAVRAGYLWTRGKLENSRQCIERVLAAGKPHVARVVATYVAPLLALSLDDDTLATRSLTDDVMSADDPGESDAELLYGVRGTWLAGRGRLAEARRDFRLGLSSVKATTIFCTPLLAGCSRYLDGDDLARVIELSDPCSLHRDDAVGHAAASLVAAIIAERSENASEAAQPATLAAQRYAALGWPMFQAQALEIAGRRDEALALYERCGAVADVRRLAGPEPRRTPSGKGSLSSREGTIAEFVTLGLTNIEIAERLSVSSKTVEKHLSSIFVKLGIRSRAQIAAFITREERARV